MNPDVTVFTLILLFLGSYNILHQAVQILTRKGHNKLCATIDRTVNPRMINIAINL
jgi:hypothetical protein